MGDDDESVTNVLKGLVELASMLGALKVVGLRGIAGLKIVALKVVDTGVGVATIILNATVD